VLAEVLKIRTVAPDSHFFDDLGADSMSMARFCARLRKRPELPAVSIRDVYRHPTIAALVSALAPAQAAPQPASRGAAAGMAAVLADLLKIDIVPVDSHFFDDLGADSMLMAQFCAKLRKRPELPTVSIKDVYRHTTITSLAAAFGGAATPAARKDALARPGQKPEPAFPDPATTRMSRSKPHFFLCGFLQTLWLLAFPTLLTFVTANGFVWISASPTPQDLYLRSLTFGGLAFAGMCLVPVLVKWLLVGRLKPRQFRVWSLTYLRFWLAKSVVQISPLARFSGSPIFSPTY
jgi:acyl carrier protein